MSQANENVRKTRLRFRQLFTGLVMLLASSAPLHAELVIEITRGALKPIPIAVVPTQWSEAGQPVADVAAVVRRDLSSSGRFSSLDPADMLERPGTGVAIDFDNWRMVAVDFVLVSTLTREADEYTLQYQLFDSYSGRQIVADSLIMQGRDLRQASHRVADAVYEAITGVPGVFSTQIAYISVSDDSNGRTFQLIVADADGNNEFVLLESRQPIMSPAWSPDGRQLAYVSFEGGTAAVYVQTLRTGRRQSVSSRPGVNNAPAWSPDGRQLALTLSDADGNLDVYVKRLSDGTLTRLTTRRSIDTEPAWSADGKSVFFTSDRGGAPQIYRIDARGGDAERVTFEGRYNARPRISADGRWLSMVHDDRGSFRVAVQDLNSGTLQVLSNGALDESQAFAPNSAQLIYATRRDGRGVLETVSVDGLISGRVKSVGNDVREPVWSPFRR